VDLAGARGQIGAALSDLGSLDDEALTDHWRWRDREISRRFGFYRCYELLEEATVGIEARRAPRPEGARILGQTTAARGDVPGLLWTIDVGLLDRDPGGGEWTLRATLGHVFEVQERYTSATADAIEHGRRGEAALPASRPPPSSDPRTLAPGTAADCRRRLDQLVDEAIARFGSVEGEAALGAAAVWAGYAVTARFRLYRMSAHLREHTIQVEKTLPRLDRPPREVDRLVRAVAGAYGRLEGAAVGDPPGLELVGAAVADVAALARAVVGRSP
jgi:hypothetical protein